MSDSQITRGSGNVYQDLNFPDAGEMQVKAQLAMTIEKIIESKGLTQVQASKLMGLSQPKLSDLLNGKFRGISEAKMLEGITRLGRDVQIVIGSEALSGQGQLAVSFG
ncbi:helix-turn-helix domain-containing protein [Desulfovibrio sp. OttesenSCG-928-G11]|nr:helix-turn-helix domain-containing protein [Desulfovibrio sp. OttesenSCG-928-G11]